MKAISIKQPWAWAIIYGGKPVENRTWPSKYIGPLLIHAGKKFDDAGYAWMIENKGILGLSGKMPSLGFPETYFKRGGIIVMVEMVDCVDYHQSPFFFGPWGFVLECPREVEFMPTRGRLGLFDIDYPRRPQCQFKSN